MKKYGQAEYMQAVMSAIVKKLRACGAISEEQERRINELNRQTVSANYPSAADLEVSA